MKELRSIFNNLSNDTLKLCIAELDHPDGVIELNSEFRKVVESVREITLSTTFSTDFMLCQMNIYKEAALRWMQNN